MIAVRYTYESNGIACYVFAGQAPNTTPLYRLFNPQTGDHFYTTSAAERDNAIAQYGYQSSDIACYVFDFQAPGTTPLFRLLGVRAVPVPSVTITADRKEIPQGQSSMLSWSSEHASSLDLEPGVGPVPSSGSRSVSPQQTTTYKITAMGPGGTASDTQLITVGEPEHDTTYPFYLDRQQIWEGPIPYAGVFGQGLNGNLKAIINPNPFRVGLLRPGHSTSEIFTNPNATIVLNPDGSTTPEDLTSIYSSSSPAFPLSIVAGIEAGTMVPDRLRLDLHYVYR